MTLRVALQDISSNMGYIHGEATSDTKDKGSIQTQMMEQVEERCSKIMQQARDDAMALEQELQIQLMKIPKKVRSMSLREFRDTYGGDINAAALGSIGGERAPRQPAAEQAQQSGTASVCRTTRRGRTRQAAAAPEPPAEGPVFSRSTRKRQAPLKQEAEPRTEASKPKRLRPGTAAAAPQTPRGDPTEPSAAERDGRLSHGDAAGSQKGSLAAVPASAAPLGATCSRVAASVQQEPQQAPSASFRPGISLTTCSRSRTAARTAAARKKGQQAEQKDAFQGIVLTTEDGRQIHLEGGLSNLPKDMQQEARQQLESLRGMVEGLLRGSDQSAEPKQALGEPGPAEGAMQQAEGEAPAAEQGAQAGDSFKTPGLAKGAPPGAGVTPATVLLDSCHSPGMRSLQKGKWIAMVAEAEEERFTQPIPGYEDIHFYVAKVVRREGGMMTIHYHATDGPNRKWYEGRGDDNKRYLEERQVDPAEIIAVFDGLTRRERKLPAKALQQIQARLAKAPISQT